MKELKFKSIWAVDVNGIQWATFRYKKEATLFANTINGIITKRKCLTNKY